VGAAVAKAEQIGRYGGTLVLSVPGILESFNPLLTQNQKILRGPIFARGWEFDPHRQEGRPGLCSSFIRAEDGLSYIFTLREGLRWSDGEPLNVDDYLFNYALVIDPKLPIGFKDLFRQKNSQGQEGFPKLEKIDDLNMRFSLLQADPLFHFALGSLTILPKHKWSEAYKKGQLLKRMGSDTPPEGLVSSGPFRVKELPSQDRIVLERNPYYWKLDTEGQRLPYLDRLIFMVVPDFNTAYLKFQDGETDLLEVRPAQYKALLQSQERFKIVDMGASFNTHYLMFNLDERQGPNGPFVDPIKLSWFKNRLFRQAISYAIDREEIVRSALRGLGEPLWAFFSPANRKWHNPKVRRYPYDLDQARALLKKAGFSLQRGQLYDRKGHPVQFSLMSNSENATRIKMLGIIQADLQRLGIQTELQPISFSGLLESLQRGRDFEVLLLGWGSGVPPDPAQDKNVLLSSGSAHYWRPKQHTALSAWEARIDTLIYQSTALFDYPARKLLVDEIQMILAEELPQIPLVVEPVYAAARRRVGNFNPSPLGISTYWNVELLYFMGR